MADWLGIGSAVGGLLGNAIGANQQNKATQKFMGIQKENQKELNQQGADLQYDMWKKTNYPAQLAMMKEAGLSTGLMYGGSGAGGTTTGSQGGGSATSGGQGANPMELGNAIQNSAQIALLKAQKENIEADTEAKKTGAAYQSGVQTEKTKEETTKIREEGRSQYLDNVVKKYSMRNDDENIVERHKTYGEAKFDDNSPMAKNVKNLSEKIEQELLLAKKENNIKSAETIIKRFEASLAEQGISSNSPYYVKLITDVLNKLGIIDWIKGM